MPHFTVRHTLGLALVGTLAVSAPAGAKVVTAQNITSPSKLISCVAMKYGGPGIECSATYLKRTTDLDPFLDLHKHGLSKDGSRGDYVGYPNPTHRTLHYGDVWKRPGIRCSMAVDGLTCHNLDGHGFHLEKGNVRRF